MSTPLPVVHFYQAYSSSGSFQWGTSESHPNSCMIAGGLYHSSGDKQKEKSESTL